MSAAKPAAVQLWTLRQEVAADLAGTLKQVADIGYKGIEAWFGAWPEADELKAIVADAGLTVISAHVAFLELRDQLDTVLDYHRRLGNTSLAVPSIPADLRESEDDWKQRVEEIATIARVCTEAGFRLAYHNHADEFEATVDGADAHDYIFASIPPEVLNVQLDTYFIKAVGRVHPPLRRPRAPAAHQRPVGQAGHPQHRDRRRHDRLGLGLRRGGRLGRGLVRRRTELPGTSGPGEHPDELRVYRVARRRLGGVR